MKEMQAVQSLAALAQEMRLRVFRLLVVAGGDGLTPGQLSNKLDVAAPTLSFHLKELTHADLISQERDGRNLIYRANFDRMKHLLAFLTEHCCHGDACQVSAAACRPRRRTGKAAA